MVTIYREMQVEDIATNLNISKTVVKQMISGYTDYLARQISRGNSIKFLNLFYIIVDGDKGTHETTAYIAHEVGEGYGISPVTAQAILEKYQENIIIDLNNGISYNIRGIANIISNFYEDGRKSIYTRKSTKYDGLDVKIKQTKYLRNCLI